MHAAGTELLTEPRTAPYGRVVVSDPQIRRAGLVDHHEPVTGGQLGQVGLAGERLLLDRFGDLDARPRSSLRNQPGGSTPSPTCPRRTSRAAGRAPRYAATPDHPPPHLPALAISCPCGRVGALRPVERDVRDVLVVVAPGDAVGHRRSFNDGGVVAVDVIPGP